MCCYPERLYLWFFALYMAFPCSLGGRYSTDYYNQSVPPVLLRPKYVFLAGKDRWFLGSCLVTGMGLGWLLNTFSLTGSLRTGFFVFAGTRTFLSFAQVSSSSFAHDLQFSWHRRPRMPAAAWSCLAFANYRLTLSFLSERLPFGMWSIPHNSLMFPGS